jgi:2'-5' RNA ligase
MTLVFAGPIDGAPESLHKDLLFSTSLLAAVMRPFSLIALGVEKFGEGVDMVDVLRLIPTPELLTARTAVESMNKSSFSTYKPHVTIGPVGSADDQSRLFGLPLSVYFDRVVACWGDEYLVFPLRG